MHAGYSVTAGQEIEKLVAQNDETLTQAKSVIRTDIRFAYVFVAVLLAR